MEGDQVEKRVSSAAPEATKERHRSETKRYSEILRDFDNLDLSLISSSGDNLLADNDSESISADSGVQTEQHYASSEDALCPAAPAEVGEGDGLQPAQEADLALCRCEGGVETALLYAKMWCRYAKDLLTWMEKRISLEQEFAKNVMKTAEGARPNMAQQEMMPLQYIYTMALEQDIKNSVTSRKTSELLQNRCHQALAAKKNEIDKWRREFKEQWAREQRRMNEAVIALKKARQQYFQRCDELEKAKAISAKAVDETTGTKTLDKRRKSKDEAQSKVMEAELMYKQCVSDAKIHQDELVKVKERIISHIRKLICQGDTVLKEATVNMFYYQRQQTEPVPLGYHNLELTCRSLEPGEPYLLYVLSRRRPEQLLQTFTFQEYIPQGKGKWKTSGGLGSLHDPSLANDSQLRRLNDGKKAGYSDSESVGGSLESLSSPAHTVHRLPKTTSTLTVSSDDLDERDMASESEGVDGQPVKARLYSRAALTHRLKKMKSKMGKCKQCDNYIVVSGVECEECGLALHRKCMEVCQLECEHRRGAVFGVDLSLLARFGQNEVPFVVLRCTSEIESRALSLQGVYRVSGSKPRIQKLCQAFEMQKEQVDLSDHSPHDITSILKHFFKELPEPVLTFELYNDFIALGKCIHLLSERDSSSNTNETVDIIRSLRQLLQKLPSHCYRTLHHVISHLQKVAENNENKMCPSNLGIVFGPTLLRPVVSTDMSMVALLETGYQAALVEFFITNHHEIFGPQQRPTSTPPPETVVALPNNPARASCPPDEVVYADSEHETPSKERPHSLESRSIKRDSSEGYISDKSSSNEAVDRLSPEASEIAVMAMIGGSSDNQGVSAGGPTSDPGTQPHYRFTRQPVKYHRHHNAGSHLSNPTRAARPVVAPVRAQPRSADSSCSSSPEPRTQRHSHHSDAHFDIPHQPLGVTDEAQADIPQSPREVVEYMLGLDATFPSPEAAATSGTREEPVQEAAAGCSAEQSASLNPNRQSASVQNVTSPSQKILSGLKLRRSHSGKDEQLFV